MDFKNITNKLMPCLSALFLCAALFSGCGGGDSNDLYFDNVGACSEACCSDYDCGAGEKCYQNACMTTWSSTFGGNDVDIFESINVTSDGDYLALGYTKSYSPGRYQGYIMKMDSYGQETWSNAIGGTGDEFYFEFIQSRAGEIVVSGSSNSFSYSRDIWSVVFDLTGKPLGAVLEDQSPFDNAEERIFSMDNTSDGGFIIAGYIKYSGFTEQAMLMKYSSDFEKEWWKSYDVGDSSRAQSVRQTEDGGFILAGRSDVYAWMMKTDGNGDEEWSKYFGTSNDVFYSVRQLFSGGYIAAGATVTYGTQNSSDMYVVKLDATGETVWTYTYGGTRKEEAKGIVETTDRSLIVAGYSYSFVDPSQSDGVMIKLDRNGNKKWLRRYGTDGEDYISGVNQASDGGLVFSGFTTVDVANKEINAWAIKSDPDGYVRALTPIYAE